MPHVLSDSNSPFLSLRHANPMIFFEPFGIAPTAFP